MLTLHRPRRSEVHLALAVPAHRHAARRGRGAPQAPSEASSPSTAPQRAWHDAAAASITPPTSSPKRAKTPFLESFEKGFNDPSHLVEVIPVTQALLEAVRRIAPSSAPSFERLVPARGSVVPTAEQMLAAFERIASEAARAGAIEVELE